MEVLTVNFSNRNKHKNNLKVCHPIHKNQCTARKTKFNKNENLCLNCYDCYILKILNCIQPKSDSQKKRMEIFGFIKEVISKYEMKAFLFGSVGLKTYLPNGDIDITVCTENQNPYKVFDIFQEQAEKKGKFCIRDVHFINAEIPLIKCTVDSIPVDITLNQYGGVETLKFLEEIDCMIGKGHLFKRSLILLKAWAYYESHILGSGQNLMSTYCFTVLLINIFHIYKKELESPLDVLTFFFDYYSIYDWKNPLEVKDFDYTSKHYVKDVPIYIQKYMNIKDPIRPNNNLGKSISYTNFLRIKKAFVKGSKDLNTILKEKKDASEIISVFFKNTWRENRGDMCFWSSQSKESENLLHFSPRD